MIAYEGGGTSQTSSDKKSFPQYPESSAVLVQSHVVRDQVEYPQPEFIVFFGVLATADKQYWKKFATFDFSDWTSKS